MKLVYEYINYLIPRVKPYVIIPEKSKKDYVKKRIIGNEDDDRYGETTSRHNEIIGVRIDARLGNFVLLRLSRKSRG